MTDTIRVCVSWMFCGKNKIVGERKIEKGDTPNAVPPPTLEQKKSFLTKEMRVKKKEWRLEAWYEVQQEIQRIPAIIIMPTTNFS
jgi:hypothetical protein